MSSSVSSTDWRTYCKSQNLVPEWVREVLNSLQEVLPYNPVMTLYEWVRQAEDLGLITPDRDGSDEIYTLFFNSREA